MSSSDVSTPQRFIQVHREIILDTGLNLSDKAIYAGLLLQPYGSITALSRRLGVSRDTVGDHLRDLEKAGWAKRQESRLICPVSTREVSERKIAWLKMELAMKPFIGEHLSFTWLDELIDSRDYIDHARPAFLRNPVTNQPMELDRIYPYFRKAFEHQGLQHFGPTEKYLDQNRAREQELRDWAKRGMSQAQGIEVVSITWKDLSLEGMLAKIPEGLPMKLVDPSDPFILYLEQESAKYRATMADIAHSQPARASG